MSMGIPVLCSPVGGLKDIIVDNENGYILPLDDSKTISRKLSEVISNNALDYVSQNAKDTVNNKFTLKKAQENFKKQMGF